MTRDGRYPARPIVSCEWSFGSTLTGISERSTGRLGRIEPGRGLDLVYDPSNPERIELA